VKGLLSIVIKIYSGKTKDEINKINFEQLFTKLDLKNHLSPSRSNGLFSVIRKITEISKI
jgi:sulfur transfer protein SufE